MLSVSSKLLKLCVRDKGLWTAFIQCYKFSRDVVSGITSSQCMECWEAPYKFVPQCCAYIMERQYWSSDSLVANEPKLLEAEILPTDCFINTKTFMSLKDRVMDVGPDRWLWVSCKWNIILSSASLCVQLNSWNGEAYQLTPAIPVVIYQGAEVWSLDNW